MGYYSRLVAVAALVCAASGVRGDTPRCVVFLHQEKSGGHSVKALLTSALKPTHRLGKCTSIGWGSHNRCADAAALVERGERVLIESAYVLGAPGLLAGNCTWVTMAREPLARVVSAFFYCTYKNPFDQLCVRNFTHKPKRRNHTQETLTDAAALDARLSEFRAFADAWREKLRFQLRMPAFANDILFKRVHMHKRRPDERRPTRMSWQLANNALAGDAEPVGATIAAAERRFAVVGLVERFRESVERMGAALELKLESNVHATHGSEAYADDARRLLARARGDAAIADTVAVDAAIYDAFAAAFGLHRGS